MTATEGDYVYSFGGWYSTENEKRTYSEGDSYTVYGDITFTAIWTKGSFSLYTITYSAGEGSGSPPEPQKAVYMQTITLSGQGSMTAPEGMYFRGWSDGGITYPAGSPYTVQTSRTFLAQWTPFVPKGVYIGIASFAGDVTNITYQDYSSVPKEL
jgi:hypothetical protein